MNILCPAPANDGRKSDRDISRTTDTMVSSKFYNYLVVLTVALGSFNYGFSSASIGSIFGLPSFFEYFHLSLAGDASAGIVGGE